MKIKEGGVMDIQNIDLRRGDFEGMHPKAKLFGFDEDKKLYTGDGVESINDQWTTWCACIGMLHLDGKEAQAVPEGFVLVPKEPHADLVNHGHQVFLGHFNEGGQTGGRSLYFAYKAMIEAQEPSNNVAPELVNNAVTYVIELQGYEAIEYARVTLSKKGYKTWDYTDKDSIDDTDIYVLCVCPSTPNDSALVKGTFKGIHQGKFTYIQSDLESCPDAQEPAND